MDRVKIVKHTGRTRRILNTDWPILHILDGNASRGYTVSAYVCNGSAESLRSWKRFHLALRFFDTLQGDVIVE
ncbi:MAG: hypothetical protein E6Q97_33525 [Desulfurellales bacterium]|nr:MAG: hypothetical protein E6Q97_33525 [Desulfurellales bacterium]